MSFGMRCVTALGYGLLFFLVDPTDPIDDVRLEMQRLGPDETRARLLDGTRKRIGSGKLWIPT